MSSRNYAVQVRKKDTSITRFMRYDKPSFVMLLKVPPKVADSVITL